MESGNIMVEVQELGHLGFAIGLSRDVEPLVYHQMWRPQVNRM